MTKPTMPTTTTPSETHTEIVAPCWERARRMMEDVKRLARLTIAGRILLGRELADLKSSLGFAGSGRRKEKAQSELFKAGSPTTWDAWCKQELGISKPTADRIIDTFQAAKLRLQRIGGETGLLALLDTPPSEISSEQADQLADLVDRLEWPDTQAELLTELHIYKRHTNPEGGDTTKPADENTEPPTARQLSFAFFGSLPDALAKVAQGVANMRVHQDYAALLRALPPLPEEEGKPSLAGLVAEIETAERDLAALKADAAAALEAAKTSAA